jgi:hypothetical protein
VYAQRPDAAILEALARLELKLTTLIQSGLAAIQEQHSRSLLDQAKLNATFAQRDRVEDIARQVQSHSAEIIALHKQDDTSTRDRRELRTDVDSVAASIDRRTLSLFTSAAGYLIAGTFVLGGAAVTVVLNHVFK